MWRSSGLTAREFAARQGLKWRTLLWWSSLLGRARRAAPAFVEVVRPAVVAAGDEGCIEIVVRGGLRVRVAGAFDPAVLRRLLAALEGR